MTRPPQDLRALRGSGILEIVWDEQRTDRHRFFEVRAACHCAHCVHEITGERILDPATIPDDIAIDQMQLVGSYAVKISWSDGHDTGLYTWERLNELS